jgi:uncharacterized protein YjbI with pentapeptide repeats
VRHQLWLDWQKARLARADQALQAYDWKNSKPADALSVVLDPLLAWPKGASPFSLDDRKSLQNCTFSGSGSHPGPFETHELLMDQTVFRGINLTGVIFEGVSLKNANFSSLGKPDGTGNVATNLTNAVFDDTALQGATFSGALMDGVVFEPATLPNADDIAGAQDLERMTYDEDPAPLKRMRQAFRDAGFDEQDRKVNYAIQRKLNDLNWKSCNGTTPDGSGRAASCLKWAAYTVCDLTCQYGLNMVRPITIGLLAWVLFGCIFFFFMNHSGSSALYMAWAEGIVLTEDEIKKAPPVKAESLRQKPNASASWIRGESRAFVIAFFFSLVNGFNLGFGQVDIGRWLHLLPWCEFEFRAKGWARTCAGLQALLTLYLVAMWVLFEFGHPLG